MPPDIPPVPDVARAPAWRISARAKPRFLARSHFASVRGVLQSCDTTAFPILVASVSGVSALVPLESSANVYNKVSNGRKFFEITPYKSRSYYA